MEEGRKHTRIVFHLPVQIKDHEGSHQITELSMGGLFVETTSPERFKKGDKIDIVVRGSQEKKPIRAACRVTRVTNKGIGIKFVDITLQDAWELIMETDWESTA